jgi:excisionase family DNA binding protein
MNQQSHSNNTYVKTTELAEMLSFHHETIRQWASDPGKRPDGFPPAVKIGNEWRFNLDEVKNFISQNSK